MKYRLRNLATEQPTDASRRLLVYLDSIQCDETSELATIFSVLSFTTVFKAVHSVYFAMTAASAARINWSMSVER
jgi:hypothetical protein